MIQGRSIVFAAVLTAALSGCATTRGPGIESAKGHAAVTMPDLFDPVSARRYYGYAVTIVGRISWINPRHRIAVFALADPDQGLLCIPSSKYDSTFRSTFKVGDIVQVTGLSVQSFWKNEPTSLNDCDIIHVDANALPPN